MKLLRTGVWSWYDIGLLKWSALLFGLSAGAYFHDYVLPYAWAALIAAILLAIRPAIVYFKD